MKSSWTAAAARAIPGSASTSSRTTAAAWHQPLAGGDVDAALCTVGLSRWHNYYLEGLSYLIQRVGIDGLYLDGINYDREVMKRVRKVMDRTRPGCLINVHCGDGFNYGDARCSTANTLHGALPLRQQHLARRRLRLQRAAGLLAGGDFGHPLRPVRRDARRGRQSLARHGLRHDEPPRLVAATRGRSGNSGTISASATPA